MHESLKQLVKKYEEMIGQEKNIYFDADQIEAIAYSFENKEDFAEALNVVNYGLSLHPANNTLLLYKAKYLLFLDYTDEAGKIILNLSVNSEETAIVRIEYEFATGNFDKGFELISNYQNSPDLSWEFCIDVINILWGYAVYEDIIKFAEKSVSLLPESVELKRELATIYKDNNNEEKAIILFNKILDIDPFNAEVWMDIAKAYWQLKDYDKAIEGYDFALAADDEKFDAVCMKGYIFYEKGEYAEALKMFQEFEEHQSEDNLIYDYIADCYSKLDMTPKAIEYINKALEKSPDNHYLLFHLAFYYQDLGNTPKAKELLDECIKIDKDNVEFIKLKAEILRQEDNYEQALVEFLRVVEIDESYDIYAQIGDIYEKLDNYNSAITYYEKSLALKPDEIRVMFRLILAYYSVNKNDKALELSFKIDELITELSEKKDSITESQLKDLEETINMINNIKKMLSDLLNTNLN